MPQLTAVVRNSVTDPAIPQPRDTGWAMSQENVEVFRRFADAQNRRDVESMLDELDADVEWHPATVGSLGGETTVFRGHIGIRELFRDLYEAFGVSQAEYGEIRDLGDRIVGLGHWVTRGEGSGAEIATPLGFVTRVLTRS